MPCILHNGSQLILTNFWRAWQVGVGVAAVVIPLVAVGGGGGDDGGKNLTQATFASSCHCFGCWVFHTQTARQCYGVSTFVFLYCSP